MNTKLPYEEYKATVIISDEVRKDLKEFYNIDADAEIECALRKDYEAYINGEFDK